MCGIVGLLYLDGDGIAPDQLRRMTDRLAHRGPDAAGYLLFDPGAEAQARPWTPATIAAAPARPQRVGLGNRRLAIIDLSERGTQPMCNEDGRLWITFNGEIYNYRELMHDLVQRGHRFFSQSDTEVILHAYEEWGEDCLNRFNGEWAFVLWDGRHERLFCGRDRFGIKPFYYLWDGRRLVVASEIKALLLTPGAPVPRPDDSVISAFLADGALDEGEATFFAGIKRLPAAHYLVHERGQVRIERYWDYDDPTIGQRYDFAQPAATFHTLLEDAVRLRLRSDALLGACLSGGLDSSSIVALAARSGGVRALETFSGVFAEPWFDESVYIAQVVERYRLDAHTVRITPDELMATLPRLVWHMDSPILMPPTYALWQVMALAAGKVKVVLDGQGSDELTGGYAIFMPAALQSAWAEKGLRPKWVALGQVAGFVRRGGTHHLYLMVRENAAGLRRQLLGRWLHPALRARVAATRPPVTPVKFSDPINQALYTNHSRVSLPRLLHRSDAMSMAHGLEARLPFLDHRLVEFGFALPGNAKIADNETKRILRQAMADRLPPPIVQRSNKRGFDTPFGLWLRGPLGEAVATVFADPRTAERGVLNAPAVKIALASHRAGRPILDRAGTHLWRWLTLELWFREFID